MSNDFIDPSPADRAAFARAEAGLSRLLRASAYRLLGDPDVPRYLDWLAQQGPELFADALPGGLQGPQAPPREALARFFRMMGSTIAEATPLPARGWQPVPLALPERGEPCLCGSGQPFGQCCEPLRAALEPLDVEEMAAVVIQMMPRRDWAGLPRSAVPLRGVVLAALSLHQAGHSDVAQKLLAPWAKLPPPWPDRLAEPLDLLGDIHSALGTPRKARQLADAMIAHGTPAVQAKGWQRLSMQAADAGREDDAREALEQAQRLAPDDPALALLEVTMLFGRGELELAAERASFHARRLARLPQAPALQQAIEMLEELAEDAPGAMVRVELEASPVLRALQEVLQGWPAPALQLALPERPVEDLGELKPAWPAAAALRDWRQVFEAAQPLLVGLQAPGADAALASMRKWLPLLRERPVLADCFEVLDGLVLMLDAMDSLGAQVLAGALEERALGLWAQLVEAQPRARCAWGWLGNRPALRLLVQHIQGDPTPTAEESFFWLRHMVEVLNPDDNHGLRERLAAVYLRRGDTQEALALCARYPEDSAGMSLLQARALWAAGRRAEAGQALGAALQANAHLAGLLAAPQPPRLPEVAHYRLGSIEDACIVLVEQADLWFDDPALRRWVLGVVQGAR